MLAAVYEGEIRMEAKEEIITNMLREGLSLDTISKCSGVSVESIQQIKEEIDSMR